MDGSTGRTLSAARQLLDRQIVGLHGTQLGNVDDVELDPDAPGGPTVTGLLSGQIALGARHGRRVGVWLTTMAQRLRGQSSAEARRFDIALVHEVGHTVVLNVPAGELPTADLEQWLTDHFIGRIPGA